MSLGDMEFPWRVASVVYYSHRVPQLVLSSSSASFINANSSCRSMHVFRAMGEELEDG